MHPDHLNLFEQLSSEHEMKNMIIIGYNEYFFALVELLVETVMLPWM